MSDSENAFPMTSTSTRLAEDSVALVTGAGSRLGRAVAKALILAGGLSRIFLLDIDETGLRKTREYLNSFSPTFPNPTVIHTVPVDISCTLSLHSAFSFLPRVDYAVNCASVDGHPPKPTHDLSLAEFDNINDVNYRGLWMCQKEELKMMLKNKVTPYVRPGATAEEAKIRGQRGAIVNVLQVHHAQRTQTAVHSATKAAVMALTKSNAREYGGPPHHIRVNAVSPGILDTSAMDWDGESEEINSVVRCAVETSPMARLGLATEVADACVFLCSGESSFMTGVDLVVDGGYTIH